MCYYPQYISWINHLQKLHYADEVPVALKRFHPAYIISFIDGGFKMKVVSLEEKMQEVFSSLNTVEGVKSVKSILETLRDRTIFPEIASLILNSRIELLYLYEEQKVLLKTMKKGITLDSTCIEEINLIHRHQNTIESTINEMIKADSMNTTV